MSKPHAVGTSAMAEIVNLRRARKQRARTEKEKTAEANRALHGRTKADRTQEAATRARAERRLDGHRIGPEDDPGRDGG